MILGHAGEVRRSLAACGTAGMHVQTACDMPCIQNVTRNPFRNQHTPFHPAADAPVECSNHQPHRLIPCGAKVEQLAELAVPLFHHITIHKGAALSSNITIGGRQHCQAH